MTRNDDVSELTFEAALERLEAIVRSVEQGKIGLQESIRQYEDGMKLIRRCRAILAEAEQKIQTLRLSDSGELTAEPFRPEAEGEKG